MYLRYTTVRKHGKTHTYWRPVRSVRTSQGVKQVTVCQLGELDEKGRLAARQLGDKLVGVERQPGLFDDPAPSEPIALDLSQLQLERGRRFGDVWLAAQGGAGAAPEGALRHVVWTGIRHCCCATSRARTSKA